MSNGQKLRIFLQTILEDNKQHLSVSQKMILDDNTGGSYEPSNYRELLGEIMSLERTKNWTELIAVYKKLPPTGKGTDIHYFIDGEECSLERFNKFPEILGIREIRGKDAHSTETNTVWMTTGTRPDSPYSKGMGGRNSIMKNATRGSGRQGGDFSSDHERM